ncbi:MAG: hypothetical protein QW134_01045 [Nitrososphaeria archaeon]
MPRKANVKKNGNTEKNASIYNYLKIISKNIVDLEKLIKESLNNSTPKSVSSKKKIGVYSENQFLEEFLEKQKEKDKVIGETLITIVKEIGSLKKKIDDIEKKIDNMKVIPTKVEEDDIQKKVDYITKTFIEDKFSEL